MRIVVDLLPLGLRNWVILKFMRQGMGTFVGRQAASMSMSESEKVD